MSNDTVADEVPAKPRSYWYVVHTYSGYEAKVKVSMDERKRNEITRKRDLQKAVEIAKNQRAKPLPLCPRDQNGRQTGQTRRIENIPISIRIQPHPPETLFLQGL